MAMPSCCGVLIAVAIANVTSALADTGTVLARAGSCPWFVMEGPVVGVCSIVGVLGGNLPAVGERVEAGSLGVRRIDDRMLACSSAIAKLHERCH